MPGSRAWPRSPTASSSRQLLSAASLFQLDALQRHCEILCSQTLSVESAVNTYKYAKVRTPAAAPDPITHPGSLEGQCRPLCGLRSGPPRAGEPSSEPGGPQVSSQLCRSGY